MLELGDVEVVESDVPVGVLVTLGSVVGFDGVDGEGAIVGCGETVLGVVGTTVGALVDGAVELGSVG